MPIVPTLGNPTTKKCLPSSTLPTGGIWLLSNNSRIHIIFLKVRFNNNISHAHSVHPWKGSYEKVPALKNTFDRGYLATV